QQGVTKTDMVHEQIAKIEKKGKENRRFRIRFGTPGDEA
ncbi:alanyl-tRNA editing protein, partial [Rhizobium leguminosarum]